MKKKEIKKLALLGMAAGAMMAGQPATAAEPVNAIDLDYVLAKPSCKAHGGCGGLTASRDVYNTTYGNEEIDEEGKKDPQGTYSIEEEKNV